MADYATLLRDHVTLKCRSIDRIFLQAYVPKLQSVGQVCIFLRWQREFKIPSSAAFGKIGEQYVKAIQRFADKQQIPMVHFQKGQDKEQVARPYLEAAAREGKERVVLIGIAQEKASVWRSWVRKGQQKASHPHMEWGRQMAFINHYYFYIWDGEWGGVFGRPMLMRRFPSGFGSTATNGRSDSSTKAGWTMRPSTMGSAAVPTRPDSRKPVIAWAPVR
jgi:hypothetical protein